MNLPKFEVRICKCGRIHFIENEKIEEALHQDKDLLVICGGCGTATKFGADRTTDFDGQEVFDMYAYTMPDTGFVLTAESFATIEGKQKGISQIIHSEGVKVMMKTGYYARYYNSVHGQFQDTWYPNFWEIPDDASAADYKTFIEKFKEESVTVDMKTLLRHLSEEQAAALSRFHIKSLNWSGTQYKTDFN